MRRLLAALVLLAALALPVAAQTPDAADLLRAVREATARLDYEAAEARAREALARPEGYAPDDLVALHAALGVVLHARGATAEAREQFAAALSLDPGLTLDPVLVSPLTLALLEEVRAQPAAATGTAEPAIRYVVLTDRRAGAAWRSALAPGWGQLHKGDRRRGLAFAAAAGTGMAATLAAQARYAAARRRYLDPALTSAEVDSAYVPYDRAFRWRNGLAVATAAVWGVAVLDALLTGAPRPPSAPRAALTLAPGGVALRIPLR